MAGTDIAAIWSDIEKWLEGHAPDRLAELLPGATDDEIAALEAVFGAPLPPDYAASLRRHNGYANLTSYSYLHTSAVEAKAESRKKLVSDPRPIHAPEAGVITPSWWNAKWVPFAEDSSGNLLCLDLDPGPNGKAGQVLVWEMSMGPAPAGFDSFGAWLADYRDGLKADRFAVDESGFIYER